MLFRSLIPAFFAAVLVVVSATDPPPASSNVLNNKNNGRTPCEMKDDFQSSCIPKRDDLTTTSSRREILPGTCTCTNAFFNLWSACVFTENHLDKTTLPACEGLLTNCTEAGVPVTNMTEADNSKSGFPGWVFMSLPANGTFDIAAAIQASTPQSRKWTLLQIILPIIVGLAVALLSILAFVYYRRRKRANMGRPWMQTKGNAPRFSFPTLKSVIKVKALNRSSSWSIEEREESMDEYQFVSYPNSMQGSRTSGHVRLSSSTSATQPPSLQGTGKKAAVSAWPGRSLWIGPYTSVRRLFDTIPLPWRSARRVHVKNVGSYGRFTVDSDSPLAQRRHESLMTAAQQSRSNLRDETIFEQEEEDSDSETEHLPLIVQEPRLPSRDAERISPGISPTAGQSPMPSPRNVRRSPAPEIPLPLPPPTQPLPPSSTSRATHRTTPSFPPAPTSPPPPPPSSRPPPRVSRAGPPAPLIPPRPAPLISPPPSLSTANVPAPLPLSSPANPQRPGHQRSDSASLRSLPTPRQPQHARNNSEASSSRSTPMTPTPPYVRAQPQQVVENDASGSPPNSAPPYVQRPSLDAVHSPIIVPQRPPAIGMRRLPQPPS